jgi:hypothetical protein
MRIAVVIREQYTDRPAAGYCAALSFGAAVFGGESTKPGQPQEGAYHHRVFYASMTPS